MIYPSKWTEEETQDVSFKRVCRRNTRFISRNKTHDVSLEMQRGKTTTYPSKQRKKKYEVAALKTEENTRCIPKNGRKKKDTMYPLKGTKEETCDVSYKRRPRASNGQRYPLPCRTHFGNLKCAQQGKGYC